MRMKNKNKYTKDELQFCVGYKAIDNNGAVFIINSVSTEYDGSTDTIHIYAWYTWSPTQGQGYCSITSPDITAIPVFDVLKDTKLGKLLFNGEFSV